MIVVVVIALVAAMAIPAFRPVRFRSQDGTIKNNMRSLAAAADQYFLEHGTSTVDLNALVDSAAYVRALNMVPTRPTRSATLPRAAPHRLRHRRRPDADLNAVSDVGSSTNQAAHKVRPGLRPGWRTLSGPRTEGCVRLR